MEVILVGAIEDQRTMVMEEANPRLRSHTITLGNAFFLSFH